MSSDSITSSVRVPDQGTTASKVLSVYAGLRQSLQKVYGGYFLATVSVVLAFLLRLLVDPWLGDQSPYLLFVVAVTVTGLYAGVRPALLAAALGTVVAYFCFVPPRYQWGSPGSAMLSDLAFTY